MTSQTDGFGFMRGTGPEWGLIACALPTELDPESGENLEVISEDTSTWRMPFNMPRLKRLVSGLRWFMRNSLSDSRIPIYIGAGSGFGDGAHPTTQPVVADLLESLSIRQSLGDVLDVGTGSGILAIIAAHLEATSVVATDIDSIARDGAEANIASNAFTNVISVRQDIPIGLVVDLVIANLYYGVLTVPCPSLLPRRDPAECVPFPGSPLTVRA